MSQVYDSLNEEKVVQCIVPQAQTGTLTGYVVNTTNARYVVYEHALGVVSTVDGSDYTTTTINESDSITNGTTLSSGTALPAANILGVEYCTGAGYLTNFPKVSGGTTLPVINDQTKFASGTVVRVVTLKNKTYQQYVSTITGSYSQIVSVVAKLCGYGVVPAV